MHFHKICNLFAKQDPKYLLFCGLKTKLMHNKSIHQRVYFVEYYEKQTGQKLTEKQWNIFIKKHPNVLGLSEDDLQKSLKTLSKFNIDESAACADPHVFSMNPVCVDNYGEILKECGFLKILPIHIIRYHTLVKSNTIIQLKKKGLIAASLKVQQKILETLREWPQTHNIKEMFDESATNIVSVRMHILQKYLNWKLNVTPEEFQKYCSLYLPFRHKPMIDYQEAIHLAQNEMKFDETTIRRNGFVISADPVNTKNLLEKMPILAGLEIREAIRREPGILKNQYSAILDIENILEEHGVSAEARRRCLRAYCLSPRAVRARLAELRALPEYQVLATNPRVLTLVVHKRKMQARLGRIAAANKQCFSLNHLVASSKIFNDYISSFGNKTCSRDVAVLVHSSLTGHTTNRTVDVTNPTSDPTNLTSDISNRTSDITNRLSDITNRSSDVSNRSFDVAGVKEVARQLSRHKYWLHTALGVIDANIRWLRERFADDVIMHNCHLLLYPRSDVQRCIERLQRARSSLDGYGGVRCGALSDRQLLSLALYELERSYHFSGDGVWPRADKLELSCAGL